MTPLVQGWDCDSDCCCECDCSFKAQTKPTLITCYNCLPTALCLNTVVGFVLLSPHNCRSPLRSGQAQKEGCFVLLLFLYQQQAFVCATAAATGQIPELSSQQVNKLRQLTVITLAGETKASFSLATAKSDS